MDDYLIQESTLDSIVHAINNKAGTQVAMTPAQMVTAIESISGGGGFQKIGEYVMAENWNAYNGLTSGTFGAIRFNIVQPQNDGLYYVRATNNQDQSTNKFYEMFLYINFSYQLERTIGRRGGGWVSGGFGIGDGNDGYLSAFLTSGTVLEIFYTGSVV